MMKTILVTGGTGFIGSHTSLVLIEKGYKLLLLDSLENRINKTQWYKLKNTQTGSPYYTNSEVNSMLADIDDFWTVTPATLESMASSIESKFGF